MFNDIELLVSLLQMYISCYYHNLKVRSKHVSYKDINYKKNCDILFCYGIVLINGVL